MYVCQTSFYNTLQNIFKSIGFPIFSFGTYMMHVTSETRRAHSISYLRFFLYYYHWVDTSAGGLVFPECIISSVQAGHFQP